MSALFDSGNGILTSFSEVPQTLELRNVPFVRQVSVPREEPTWQSDYNVSLQLSAEEFGSMVSDSLYALDADWMYSAIIQTALKGPHPAWNQRRLEFCACNSCFG